MPPKIQTEINAETAWRSYYDAITARPENKAAAMDYAVKRINESIEVAVKSENISPEIKTELMEAKAALEKNNGEVIVDSRTEIGDNKAISTGDLIDGLKIIDGKVGGKIPVDEYKAIRKDSIKNPESNIMTLGRYTPTKENGIEDWSKPGPDSYIKRAGNSSYFDMGSREYKRIQKEYGMEGYEMFDYFNKPALDDAFKSNKSIRFSHNPLDFEKGAIVEEWEYIKSVLGKTDNDLIMKGGFWYVR